MFSTWINSNLDSFVHAKFYPYRPFFTTEIGCKKNKFRTFISDTSNREFPCGILKRIEMKVMDNDVEYLMSIQVNGVVAVTDNAYDTITNEIVKVVERTL